METKKKWEQIFEQMSPREKQICEILINRFLYLYRQEKISARGIIRVADALHDFLVNEVEL